MDTIKYDKKNLQLLYGDENKEWAMEKIYYIVDLPGDVWENSNMMQLIKDNIPHRTADNRVKFEWLLNEHEVHTELSVKDPNDA